ncbi:uncharacterized protein LOC117109088 [Anneissia japonica]|uniref:uncharacterized protein LOC117109088 n=1 Tax=Anneissia japonica TaxID=1529436 RepID=UPI001425630C|nr:uncharacterized protein LOC117109088 [Anneissia japonica]
MLSFLIAGHTKFSVNWCFGLFKREFSWTCISDDRKKYLFKEVRQFCRQGTEELVCPDPEI